MTTGGAPCCCCCCCCCICICICCCCCCCGICCICCICGVAGTWIWICWPGMAPGGQLMVSTCPLTLTPKGWPGATPAGTLTIMPPPPLGPAAPGTGWKPCCIGCCIG